MIPVLDTILFETRFENRVFIISEQFEYLENQFNSNFSKVRDQVSINTSHLARDQQQISRLTENLEILTKEVLKINEGIVNIKSSFETLTNRQINFEKKINKDLAVLNQQVDTITKELELLSIK